MTNRHKYRGLELCDAIALSERGVLYDRGSSLSDYVKEARRINNCGREYYTAASRPLSIPAKEMRIIRFYSDNYSRLIFTLINGLVARPCNVKTEK